MCCRRFLFALWPPYEASVAKKEISTRIEDDQRWESIRKDVENALSGDISFKELNAAANQTQDYEIARKEGLESKALIFASGSSIAAGVMSVVPAIFSPKWGIPVEGALVAGIIYLIAIIHLWIAAYYGIQTRQIKGLARPSATALINELNNEEWNDRGRALMGLANTKWNEDFLLLKSNCLSVAEDMFLRGLALIATAAIVSVIFKLLLEYGFGVYCNG